MDSPNRNPSPPPEIVAHSELITEESIGNTAFSKHWLFSTLMKLIEEVDRENQEDDSEGEQTGESAPELAVDVDDDLQNELCKLWDMSMNSEVAQFLNEFKAVEILTEVIQKAKAPRVTEICVGILGNLACETSICKMMSDKQKLIDLILMLMETRDTPTLVENTRLVFTSLSNSQTRGPWIRSIQRSEDILNHLMFIFGSSTNCELLKNSADLVDVLLDLEPDLCVSWATTDFIHSLLEATQQIGSHHSEALEVYLHIFQSFSTTQSGVEALVEHGQRLTLKILKYLTLMCEYEIVSVDEKEGPLTSALSVLNILITTLDPCTLADVFTSEKLMRIMLKILEPLYPMLQGYRGENHSRNIQTDEPIISQDSDQVTSSNQSETTDPQDSATEAECKTVTSSDDKRVTSKEENDKEQHRQLEMLYEILTGLLKDYCSIILKETIDTCATSNIEDSGSQSGPDSTSQEATTASAPDSVKGDNSEVVKETAIETMSDGDKTDLSKGDNIDIPVTSRFTTEDSSAEKVVSPVNNMRVLTYLDEACSRCRINYLGLCLKESEQGVRYFEQFQILAKKHCKERLCRIFGDVTAGKIVTRAESVQQEVAETAR